jgi:predicted secreted protein
MSDYVAVLGLQTEIRIEIAAVMTNIPYATAITMPGIVFDTVDVTTNTSPNGFREFIPGLADGGEVTFTLNWHDDEATHQELWEAQQAREVVGFQVAMPQFATNNLFDFQGFVTGLPINSPIDAQVTQDVTIKITGNIEKSTE